MQLHIELHRRRIVNRIQQLLPHHRLRRIRRELQDREARLALRKHVVASFYYRDFKRNRRVRRRGNPASRAHKFQQFPAILAGKPVHNAPESSNDVAIHIDAFRVFRDFLEVADLDFLVSTNECFEFCVSEERDPLERQHGAHSSHDELAIGPFLCENRAKHALKPQRTRLSVHPEEKLRFIESIERQNVDDFGGGSERCEDFVPIGLHVDNAEIDVFDVVLIEWFVRYAFKEDCGKRKRDGDRSADRHAQQNAPVELEASRVGRIVRVVVVYEFECFIVREIVFVVCRLPSQIQHVQRLKRHGRFDHFAVRTATIIHAFSD